ncbi:MAG: HDOD domain-containing protein [Pseudomonadota bacterium]|nr:HDOD domain-containing protein [Pseudomonadota bacterium]
MTANLEQLQPGELPIFRRTRGVLLAFGLRREQVTAPEVAAEILADPLATLYTLHTINKRVSARSDAEVNTVEHALMMQGIGAFLDAARRLPILEDSPAGRNPRVLAALHALARRAQHAAWQARDFAVLHSDVRAEEVQVAALLHDTPEMLLWLRTPEQAIRLQRQRRRSSDSEAETTVLGDTLAHLRLSLLESWNIPPLTLDLLSPKNAERTRQTLLAACIDIAQLSERGWWDEKLMAAYTALAGVENTALETIIATVHANAARVARCCDWLEAPPAATWGPMIPGPWPPEADDEEKAAPATPQATPATVAAAQPPASASQPLQPAPPVRPVQAPAPEAEPEHDICPMPDKHIFREALKGIEEHLDGSLTLNQMSAVILKGLHTGLGLSRIIFAMQTPDGLRVKSRFTLGISAEDPLRHFEFELASKDLFCQLMGKMQGVWLNEGNRQKLWPMIHPKLQAMLGNGDFYTMSLYNGSKPLGLIYADRGKGEGGNTCGLDPLTYTDFKMLCLQAARGLGKVKAPV